MENVIVVNGVAEMLTEANKELPTVKIRGKDYVMVKDRVAAFRRSFPYYSIVTQIEKATEDTVIIKATVLDEKRNEVATGYAREEQEDTGILATSFLEVCETSAIGRALACLGIGIADSYGSADEVRTAQNSQAKEDVDGLSTRELERLIDVVKHAKGDDRETAIGRIEFITSKKMRQLTKEDYAKVAMEVSNG